MRERYLDLDVLLLDDVQFLTGQAQAQEMLLRTVDALTARGAQVVLASDRPPADINGLDARLLSRFSGGLIVDIGLPDYETKVAILRRKAEDRKMALAPGVAEAMARFPAKNVRELQGALNRLLATQELEERTVTAEELPALLGERFIAQRTASRTLGASIPPESAFLTPQEPDWLRRMRESAEVTERDGFSAARLLRYLDEGVEPEGWQGILDGFLRDIARAREIRIEVDQLGNPWPEAAANLLRDPDRLDEAESLLTSARERAAPFPTLPDGPLLETLSGGYPPLSLRAATRLIEAERPDYNPLYVHSTDPDRARVLLEAAGRSYLARVPGGKVGFISVSDFSEDFIRGISDGVAGAWRERWWSLELLLLYGIEGLSRTERAQDEFFHLFEALIRRDGRIILSADRPPSQIEGVDERLRSRFEGGLVLDLGGVASPAPPASPDRTLTSGTDDLTALREMAGAPKQGEARNGEDREDLVVVVPPGRGVSSTELAQAWFPSPEKAVLEWPVLEDRLVEEES
jgi:chromosomal replication initiation ATPase DnaA